MVNVKCFLRLDGRRFNWKSAGVQRGSERGNDTWFRMDGIGAKINVA